MNLNLRQMSREEKLRAMHALWEDLAQEDEAVESPGWHGESLKETEERMQSGAERIRDWEEAKEELRRRAR
jgi:hypothetical protein